VSERSDESRRGFLLAMGRYSLALLLSAGVGGLSLRRRGRCEDPGLCRQCALLEGCELPSAVSLRQSTEDVQGCTDARETEEDDAAGVPA
jgi:hypothetical protein